MRLAVAALLAAALSACKMPSGIPLVSPSAPEPAFPEGWTVVDLTRRLDPETPFISHAKSFPFERVEFKETREFGWRTGGYSGLEHMGTHLAAPLARLPAGDSVDRVPAAQLVLPLVVLDLPATARDGGTFGVADIQTDEKLHGPIPPASIVVLRTGHGALASADPALLARKPDGTYAFPGWNEDAIRMLALERRVRAIGTDAMAVDSGTNVQAAPAQSAGSAAGLWFVVGIGDLTHVPSRGATLVVGAAPIAGAAGAPARVLALVPPKREP